MFFFFTRGSKIEQKTKRDYKVGLRDWESKSSTSSLNYVYKILKKESLHRPSSNLTKRSHDTRKDSNPVRLILY